jgi:hypothetical protein
LLNSTATSVPAVPSLLRADTFCLPRRNFVLLNPAV